MVINLKKNHIPARGVFCWWAEGESINRSYLLLMIMEVDKHTYKTKGTEQDDVIFQVVAVDYYNRIKTSSYASMDASSSERDLTLKEPIVVMHGRRLDGRVVTAHLSGFRPFFFIRLPDIFAEMCEARTDEAVRSEFVQQVTDLVCEQIRSLVVMVVSYTLIAVDCEGYYGVYKQLFPFTLRKNFFVKVQVTLPEDVPKMRKIITEKWYTIIDALASQLSCASIATPELYGGHHDRPGDEYIIYEADVLYPQRFLLETRIVPCGWVWVPKEHIHSSIRSDSVVLERPGDTAKNTLVLRMPYTHVQPLSLSDPPMYRKNAPLRILSFDAEMDSEGGKFPSPTENAVLQIACEIMTIDSEKGGHVVDVETRKKNRHVFMLVPAPEVLCGGTRLPVSGALRHKFYCEEDLIAAFFRFVRDSDIDIITGYNIIRFDIPFIMDRMKHIGSTYYYNRIMTMMSKWTESKAFIGEPPSYIFKGREVSERRIKFPGFIIMDGLNIARSPGILYGISSFTLNSVCYTVLGDTKNDMHYSAIHKNQEAGPRGRDAIAEYCVKDAYLVNDLIDNQQWDFMYIEFARIIGLNLQSVIDKGQTQRVLTALMNKTKDMYRDGRMPHMYLVPVWTGEPAQKTKKFEGAVVQPPLGGYYPSNIYVVTFDVVSLYPSLMRAFNICYTSYVAPVDVEKVKAANYTVRQSHSGHFFIEQSSFKSLISQMLEDVLGARKIAKGKMAAAFQQKDLAAGRAWNTRQTTLKLVANSVYGVSGSQRFVTPHCEFTYIGASVTAEGRATIMKAKEVTEDHFNTANGYRENAVVIYGDTDSIMVVFGKKYTRSEVYELCAKATAIYDKTFRKEIKLEYEKMFSPYLLLRKKKYIGMKFEKPSQTEGKWTPMGSEAKRTDGCPFVGRNQERLVKSLFRRDSMDDVKTEIDTIIREELQATQPRTELFICTQGYKKHWRNYTNLSKVAKLIQKYELAGKHVPAVGSKVPYVVGLPPIESLKPKLKKRPGSRSGKTYGLLSSTVKRRKIDDDQYQTQEQFVEVNKNAKKSMQKFVMASGVCTSAKTTDYIDFPVAIDRVRNPVQLNMDYYYEKFCDMVVRTFWPCYVPEILKKHPHVNHGDLFMTSEKFKEHDGTTRHLVNQALSDVQEKTAQELFGQRINGLQYKDKPPQRGTINSFFATKSSVPKGLCPADPAAERERQKQTAINKLYDMMCRCVECSCSVKVPDRSTRDHPPTCAEVEDLYKQAPCGWTGGYSCGKDINGDIFFERRRRRRRFIELCYGTKALERDEEFM